MSNFVYDLTTLPGSKSDLVPTPPGADLSKYLPATHWNTHIQASYDIRDAIRKGVFQGLLEQASDPAPSDPNAYWWLQDTGVLHLVGPTNLNFSGTISAATPTDPAHLATKNYVDTHASLSPLTTKGDLYTRTATADARIGVVGNGKLLSSNSATTTGLEWIDPPVTTKTLQGAYTDGGAGPQIINLSASGKGVLIRDTLAGIGEALFAVQNSTGVTSHLAVNSDGTVTMAGALTVTGVVIGATPTLSTHLTTKGYVDGLITGLSWKAMVKYASTPAGGNITLNGDQSIDGNTTTEGDRVLLKNQTNPIENGIWIAHTGAAWTRAADMPAGSHGATTACFVDIGTINQDTSWFCSTEGPTDIVGTDALAFQIFSNTISQHNALTGLDGGTSGQYYHLTSAQHTGLVGIATGGVTFASATGVLATDASDLFWDNSSKRLGIGTTTPNAKFVVKDTTAVNSEFHVSSSVVATFGGLNLDACANNLGTLFQTGRIRFSLEDGTAGHQESTLEFQTMVAGTLAERMRISANGSVGIGTDSPGSLLDVHGDLTVTGGLGLYTAISNYTTLAQYDVVYALYTSSQIRVDLADADAESTARVIGVIVSGGGAGSTVTYVTCGVYRMSFDATVSTSDIGKPVYLSTTAGKATLTPPASGSGDVLLRLGYLIGAENGGSTRYENSVVIHIGDEFQL